MSADPEDVTELDHPVTLATFVRHQAGGIVSRTLLKQPGGTVTAFAFDAGQGLSEHTSPYEALVVVSEGEAEIAIAGTPHRVAGGRMLRLPAGQPHAVKAITRFTMLLILVRA